MIVLNLDDTNRILSAGRYAKVPDCAVLVNEADLPDGNLYEYRYENGTFIHDPLPEAEEPEQEEDRVSMLEKRLDEMETSYAEGVQNA